MYLNLWNKNVRNAIWIRQPKINRVQINIQWIIIIKKLAQSRQIFKIKKKIFIMKQMNKLNVLDKEFNIKLEKFKNC